MRDVPLSELQTKIRSRSGIIDLYVKYLIERDEKEKHLRPHKFPIEAVYTTIYNLALEIQQTGQSLAVEEAVETIVKSQSSDSEQKAHELLSSLNELGILTLNKGYVRFWHHTLQEYFYAGSFVTRWRMSGKSLETIPRRFQRLIRKSTGEDPFIYVIAHLSEKEIDDILPRISKYNPGLVISWADDLLAENRCAQTVQKSLAIVRKMALNSRKYSKISMKRGTVIARLIGIGMPSLLILILALIFVPKFSLKLIPASLILLYVILLMDVFLN
jgi:hypothetical protein